MYPFRLARGFAISLLIGGEAVFPASWAVNKVTTAVFVCFSIGNSDLMAVLDKHA